MQLDRILIVDEDQSVRRVIKETLGKSYDILEAKHGFEAVRIADSLKPALIILDLKTPGLSGTDVCRRLKETKHTRNIPVILTASHFNKVEIVAGLKAGADDYLTKPINPGDVLVRVEAHLRYRNFYEGLEPRDSPYLFCETP
jgi:DNA-binding response OmpR family regulator